MKRIAIATMLAAILLLVMPTAVSAAGVRVESKIGDGKWEGNTWGVCMFPGETANTTLTLYNSSTSSLDVEVTITPNPSCSGNVTFELDKSAFTIPGRSNTDITLTATASGSAVPRTYTAILEIKSEIPPAPLYVGGGGGISSPKVSEPGVGNTTENSVDIAWTTSRPMTSIFTYWSSPKVVIENNSYIREHSVRLENLASGTVYNFEIVCVDIYGLKDCREGIFITLEKVAEVVEPEPVLELEPEPKSEPEPTLEPTFEPEPELVPEPEPEIEEPEIVPVEIILEPAGVQWWWILLSGVGASLMILGIIFWIKRRRIVTP